jgi:tRNA(Ile)-lysidine synthase
LRSGLRDIDFAMVQGIIEFIKEPTVTRQKDIGQGLRVVIEDENLILSEWEIKLPTSQWPQIQQRETTSALKAPFQIPGEYELDDGWVLKAEYQLDLDKAKNAAKKNKNPYRAWIDLGEQDPVLNIRKRFPGDRFRPLGMGGNSMKISDFMINQKIPHRAREGWPLVCFKDEIAWVPGYLIAHPYRVRDDSRQVILLSLLKL